jgi:hypothetical protein
VDYPTINAHQAERNIKAALAVLALPTRGSYNLPEVCSILGIVDRTFRRLQNQYELDKSGKLVRPDCLKSFLQGNARRVTYAELVDFIRRNDELLRNHEKENA